MMRLQLFFRELPVWVCRGATLGSLFAASELAIDGFLKLLGFAPLGHIYKNIFK